MVETDASNVSVDAVLAQKRKDGKIHPVQYASRTITEAVQKYRACEGEELAIIFALKLLRVQLLSCMKFCIITGYQALKDAFQKGTYTEG